MDVQDFTLIPMLKSIFPLTFASFFTRMTGFLRDYLLYRSFQAGQSLDLFFLAFRFPQLMRRFFAEGSFQQALLPVLGKAVKEQNEKDFQSLYQQAFWFLLLSTLGLSAIIWSVGPYYVSKALASGLNPQSQEIYWQLLCWSAPYAIALAVISLYSLVLQLHHSYWLNGFSPTLMNLAILLAAYIYPAQVLPMIKAMFFIGFVQVLLQMWQARSIVPFSLRIGLPSWPHGSFLLTLRRFLELSGLSIMILTNIWVDQMFLTYAPVGSISIYYLCERVVEIPVGVLGYSVWSVFSTYYVRFSHSRVARIQLEHKVILLIIYLIFPATAAVFCLAPEIVACFIDPLSQQQAFTQANFLLHLISIEIVLIVISKIYVIMLTSMHRNKEILSIHAVGVCVNFVMDALLYQYGAIGIGLSTVLTLCVQMMLFHKCNPFLNRLLRLPPNLIFQPIITLCTLLLTMIGLRMFFIDYLPYHYMRIPLLAVGFGIPFSLYFIRMRPFFEYLNGRVTTLVEHDRQTSQA
ncbi:MAG: hypothetical protein FJ161_01110 [Gammaproteobacteria bacterium]|nr:hypothetical protein [Gammaproteobacteria bacterium]